MFFYAHSEIDVLWHKLKNPNIFIFRQKKFLGSVRLRQTITVFKDGLTEVQCSRLSENINVVIVLKSYHIWKQTAAFVVAGQINLLQLSVL